MTNSTTDIANLTKTAIFLIKPSAPKISQFKKDISAVCISNNFEKVKIIRLKGLAY